MKRKNVPPPQLGTRRSRAAAATCELCARKGGVELWRDAQCRVVLIAEPGYAGYCRVIWNSHVREMTDLAAAQQRHCMRVVFAVEAALRNVLAPHKINIASLGNMTPHVHWHVIPRYERDAHFPNPIWGLRMRGDVSKAPPRLRARIAAELAKLMAQFDSASRRK